MIHDQRAKSIGMRWLLQFAADVEDGKGLEKMCKLLGQSSLHARSISPVNYMSGR
jgi:hypothetical protein